MKWKNEAMEKLRQYHTMRHALRNIPLEIDRLAADASALRAARTDGVAVKGGGNRREEALINNLVERQELENSLEQVKRWLSVTDRGLLALTPEERLVVAPALEKAEQTGKPAAAMALPDGRILTGKTSDLLGASAALLLNALKALGGIPDEMHLISPKVIDPIQHLKVDHFGNRNPRLHTDEVLIALSISAATDPTAEIAMEQLGKLRGCEVHSSVILSHVDVKTFKRLGVNLTCEPRFKA